MSEPAALFADLGRPRLMGVVNVTPDSFSDGGRWAEPDTAIAHARDLLAAGADILDIGGESTRPGATRPLVEEELARVVPVISALAAEGAVVSVDTMRAEVAAAALAAGATLVNDVSGGLADPAILDVVGRRGSDVRRHALARAQRPHARLRGVRRPGGVVEAVRDELAGRVDAMLAAGIARDRIVLDPGLGFAKRPTHNWELLAGLDRIADSATRSSWGRAGSRSSGPCSPVRTVPRGRSTSGRHANTAVTVHLAAQGVWGLGCTTYAPATTRCAWWPDWRRRS
jgi:dihydropteroate synthase